MIDDRFFIDTGIFIYSKIEDQKDSSNYKKHQLAVNFLQQTEAERITSVQVVNEFSIMLLKLRIPGETVQAEVKKLSKSCVVTSLTLATLELAWKVRNQYNLFFWDSLIVASALENECTRLCTENLPHIESIDQSLKVINPLAG